MENKLVRFGVSLPQQLINKFDAHIREKNYSNRSEAIRDLIRQELIEEEIDQDEREVIGALHLLYNHHKRELSDQLTSIQHDLHHLIISSTHVHLDHDNCLEVILLRGQSSKLRHLANQLIALKGVIHGRLYLTSRAVQSG
ncbi:MAG TPA: nickel-responsive transcriptional regulator NikR [Caldithrix abyssi]|uniref:Putative nickel-responsive regulator n=1 Tax=Caldithrix abyssi TaxID=187145 RepID=A0A7V4U1F0_CALAY|nr:nickel-responsive transcriptional regulator NikR [Caldithrix abyssi]